MENKSVNILNILLPIFLLVGLMTIALINYPVIFDKSKGAIIIIFVALTLYIFIWKFIKPDNFSKNGGLLIGLLFIINISIEDFINWQSKTSILVSTLTMMFLVFISFSMISAIRTLRTRNILKGIKSSLISPFLGTVTALCFGFLICYLFSGRMVNILQSDRGFNDYNNPKSFTFFNAFDNASSHVIMAPVISIIMGALGGVTALIIIGIKKESKQLNNSSDKAVVNKMIIRSPILLFGSLMKRSKQLKA